MLAKSADCGQWCDDETEEPRLQQEDVPLEPEEGLADVVERLVAEPDQQEVRLVTPAGPWTRKRSLFYGGTSRGVSTQLTPPTNLPNGHDERQEHANQAQEVHSQVRPQTRPSDHQLQHIGPNLEKKITGKKPLKFVQKTL